MKNLKNTVLLTTFRACFLWFISIQITYNGISSSAMKRLGIGKVIKAMVNNITVFTVAKLKEKEVFTGDGGSEKADWSIPSRHAVIALIKTFLRLDNLNKKFPPLKIVQLCAIYYL